MVHIVIVARPELRRRRISRIQILERQEIEDIVLVEITEERRRPDRLLAGPVLDAVVTDIRWNDIGDVFLGQVVVTVVAIVADVLERRPSITKSIRVWGSYRTKPPILTKVGGLPAHRQRRNVATATCK